MTCHNRQKSKEMLFEIAQTLGSILAHTFKKLLAAFEGCPKFNFGSALLEFIFKFQIQILHTVYESCTYNYALTLQYCTHFLKYAKIQKAKV